MSTPVNHVRSTLLGRCFHCLSVLTFCFPFASHALEVDEIVSRHTEALGGKARLAALQSLRLVGKISFGTGDSSIDMAWMTLLKRPGMIREEASLQGLTGVSA